MTTTTQSRPDGLEVVATAAEAQRMSTPPLLVVDVVTEFLDQHALGIGPLSWERIGDGQSNITYRLRRGAETFVLRRGPRPPLPKSTHDMVREARIQRLLGEQGVPVPTILAICEDESLLGVPFYIMSFLEGMVITDSVPPVLDAPAQREETSRSVVDTLSQLHSVDVTTGELSRLGRPEGYLKRQVQRFAALWDVNTTRQLPLVHRIAAWLEANLPETQKSSLVHGDYRIGNLMFADQAPAIVIGILDWEMSTLGDPLADLGYLTATYTEAGDAPTVMELTPVTAGPGFLTRKQIVTRYADHSGLDVSALPWYETLALWKSSIFCEAIYTRWLKGERPHDTTFGPSLEAGIPHLLDRAESFMGRL